MPDSFYSKEDIFHLIYRGGAGPDDSKTVQEDEVGESESKDFLFFRARRTLSTGRRATLDGHSKICAIARG